MRTATLTAGVATILAAALAGSRAASAASPATRPAATQPGSASKPAPNAKPDVLSDAPVQSLRAGGDVKKRYFLIKAKGPATPPPNGYKLLIVLAGGDGSAEFHPFIRRIHENFLNEQWLLAEPVAVKWTPNQQVTWPTEKLRPSTAKFTTEEYIEAIVADLKAKTQLDSRHIFLFGWASGGPPCYVASLRKGSPITGAFVAMSVFHQNEVQAIENAKGKAYFILQSPDDRMVPARFAEAARDALQAAGAKVQYQQYAGGNGWQGEAFGSIPVGIEWLDNQANAQSERKEATPK